jgi:hypothetical protein
MAGEIGHTTIDVNGRHCKCGNYGCLEAYASGPAIATRAREVLVREESASAMGTPTVAIFGPTVPEFGFGPLAPARVVVGHDALACRPCDRHGPRRCPLVHFRCMRELSAEQVAAAARRLLLTPDALA